MMVLLGLVLWCCCYGCLLCGVFVCWCFWLIEFEYLWFLIWLNWRKLFVLVSFKGSFVMKMNNLWFWFKLMLGFVLLVVVVLFVLGLVLNLLSCLSVCFIDYLDGVG